MWASAARIIGPRLVKVVAVGLMAAAVLALLTGLVLAVKAWNTATYNNGFNSGSSQMEARWKKAEAANALSQRDMVAADALNSNAAIRGYLADIASKEPEVIRVKERTTVYAQGVNRGLQCLDVDGVRLIQEHRNAIGFVAPAASADTGTVRGVVPVGEAAGGSVGRNDDPTPSGS